MQVKLLNQIEVEGGLYGENLLTPFFTNPTENGYIVKVIFYNKSASMSITGNIVLKRNVMQPNERFSFDPTMQLTNSYYKDVVAKVPMIEDGEFGEVKDIYVPAHTGIYMDTPGYCAVSVFGIEYPA